MNENLNLNLHPELDALLKRKDTSDSLELLAHLIGKDICIESLDGNIYQFKPKLHHIPDLETLNQRKNLNIYGHLKCTIFPGQLSSEFSNFQNTDFIITISELISQILKRSYEIDSISAATQLSINKIIELDEIAKTAITSDINSVTHIFLNHVMKQFDSQAAFAVIISEHLDLQNVHCIVRKGEYMQEREIKLNYQEQEILKKNVVGSNLYDLQIWKNGETLPAVLAKLLDNSASPAFTAPLKLSQRFLGCIGVSTGKRFNIESSVEMQWFTLYLSLIASTIAAAVWRDIEIKNSRRVAHHAKNSIANIQGLVWRLNEAIKKGISEKDLSYIKNRMSKLVTRLDEMEKDASQTMMEHERIKTSFLLNELLNELVTDSSHAFPDLKININLSQESLRTYGIKSDIYNALWELITNSAYWTAHKGNVTISVKKVDAKNYSQRLIKTTSELIQIDLSDTGKGIPLENRENIFMTGYSNRGSTGYGLAFAREAIQRCHGWLYADEPEDSQGAHFVILLPISQ